MQVVHSSRKISPFLINVFKSFHERPDVEDEETEW